MNCPKCGTTTIVKNSRSLESRGDEYLKSTADKVVGWYTQDWRIIIRKCTNSECKYHTTKIETLELLVSDIKEMFKDGTKY